MGQLLGGGRTAEGQLLKGIHTKAPESVRAKGPRVLPGLQLWAEGEGGGPVQDKLEE